MAEEWDLSCRDWQARLRDGRSLVPDLPLDPQLARMATGCFDKLRLYDVIGQPTMGEACGQWFRDIVAALFGSLDLATGVRRIHGLFVLVPKKNAKTTNSAGLMLTALLVNRRPSAEFLLTAPSQEISDKAFATVRGMIQLDPDGFLQKRFHIANHAKTITDRKTEAVLKVKTFDEDIVTGAVVAGALIDEIHLLGRKPRAAAIIQQLRGGMVSTPEAFFAMITTQAFDAPAGVFRAELQMARAIRDGRAKVDTLPVLYEFSEAQQKDRTFWEDPENWARLQPNLGRSIRIPRLVKDYEEARLKDEKDVRIWASQHLNIEIGLALQSDRWAGADHWEAATDDDLDLDAILARSDAIIIGADGGGLDDLLGVAVLGRCASTRRWLLWTHAWAHASVFERRKDIAARLRDLAAAGDLSIVEQLGDDVEQLGDIFGQVNATGLLYQIGVDPAGVGAIVEAAGVAGVEADRIVGVSQGWKLSGAIKTAERALADGTLRHGGQALMSWCVGNAKVEPRGNALTITKQAAGSAKIDPLMAMFDAVALMSLNPATRSIDQGFVDLGSLAYAGD